MQGGERTPDRAIVDGQASSRVRLHPAWHIDTLGSANALALDEPDEIKFPKGWAPTVWWQHPQITTLGNFTIYIPSCIHYFQIFPFLFCFFKPAFGARLASTKLERWIRDENMELRRHGRNIYNTITRDCGGTSSQASQRTIFFCQVSGILALYPSLDMGWKREDLGWVVDSIYHVALLCWRPRLESHRTNEYITYMITLL